MTTTSRNQQYVAMVMSWLSFLLIPKEAIDTRAASATALSNATWTDAKAAYVDASIASRGTSNLTTANLGGLTNVTLAATQTGVTIPTVTTYANAPADSTGVTTLVGLLTPTHAGTWTRRILASRTSTVTNDSIWQTDLSGYSTAGQAGHLKNAGAAADPWSTPLPQESTRRVRPATSSELGRGCGSVECVVTQGPPEGKAGYIVGHNLDATTSRAVYLCGRRFIGCDNPSRSSWRPEPRYLTISIFDAAVSTRSTYAGARSCGCHDAPFTPV